MIAYLFSANELSSNFKSNLKEIGKEGKKENKDLELKEQNANILKLNNQISELNLKLKNYELDSITKETKILNLSDEIKN